MSRIQVRVDIQEGVYTTTMLKYVQRLNTSLFKKYKKVMKENFCGNWIEISEPLAWILSYRALDVWQENSRLAMVDLFLEATCMLQQYYYCFQLSELCNTLVNKYNVPYDSSLTQAGVE